MCCKKGLVVFQCLGTLLVFTVYRSIYTQYVSICNYALFSLFSRIPIACMYILCIWSSCCNPGEWPRHYCSADDKTWGKMSVKYRKAIKIISSQGLYIILNNLQGRSTCLSTMFVGDRLQLYQSCSSIIAGGFSIWHVLLQAVISRAVKMSAKWFGKGKGSQNSNLPLHHEEEMLVYIYFCFYKKLFLFPKADCWKGRWKESKVLKCCKKVFNLLCADHLHIYTSLFNPFRLENPDVFEDFSEFHSNQGCQDCTACYQKLQFAFNETGAKCTIHIAS